MDAKVIETVIKDCGVPGRLVAVDRKSVQIDLFDDRTESFHRFNLGLSEFCDLALDWRSRRGAAKVTGKRALRTAA
jgi:hypothetical protein